MKAVKLTQTHHQPNAQFELFVFISRAKTTNRVHEFQIEMNANSRIRRKHSALLRHVACWIWSVLSSWAFITLILKSHFSFHEKHIKFFWRVYISLCINVWLIYYVSWSLPVRINFKLILMTYKLNHYDCFSQHKIYIWDFPSGKSDCKRRKV